MAKKQSVKKKRRVPKTVLRLPDLDQAKSAVLNSLSSVDAQRGHRHAIKEFVEWYCSEPRLSFSKTVVLRYRIHLESRHLAPGTINLRLGAVRRLAYEASDCGLLINRGRLARAKRWIPRADVVALHNARPATRPGVAAGNLRSLRQTSADHHIRCRLGALVGQPLQQRDRAAVLNGCLGFRCLSGLRGKAGVSPVIQKLQVMEAVLGRPGTRVKDLGRRCRQHPRMQDSGR